MRTQPAKTIDELLSALTYIIDLEEGKENYHSWRTAILAAHFSQNIKNAKKIRDIFYAGLLEDIGAAGLSTHIVNYLKRDNKDDRYILLSHPIIGAQLTSNIPQMTAAAKLILDHHEWINGRGYPRGKIEKNILLGSRIIRLADSIDVALQNEPLDKNKLSELKNKMSEGIGKEYSGELFSYAFDILNKDNLFSKICAQGDIPSLFKETKDKIGFIRLPSKIDAIGTTLEVVSQVIDMRHPYNAGHSVRVSRYAMAIALAMNLSHDEITRVKWAGLIHDIGKFSISRFIMNKPGSLTQEEFQIVKKHATITYEIMNMLPSLKDVAPIACGHHEYFDGSGYPRGLKGDQTPLGARILVVCDAFDAMTSNRPYRQPLTPPEACQEIEKLSGRQFDPEIAKFAQPLFLNLGL